MDKLSGMVVMFALFAVDDSVEKPRFFRVYFFLNKLGSIETERGLFILIICVRDKFHSSYHIFCRNQKNS